MSFSVRKHPLVPITDDYRRRAASAIRPFQYNLIFQNLKLPTENRVRVIHVARSTDTGTTGTVLRYVVGVRRGGNSRDARRMY